MILLQRQCKIGAVSSLVAQPAAPVAAAEETKPAVEQTPSQVACHRACDASQVLIICCSVSHLKLRATSRIHTLQALSLHLQLSTRRPKSRRWLCKTRGVYYLEDRFISSQIAPSQRLVQHHIASTVATRTDIC